jgi:phosphate transport system permease protein
MSGRRLLRRRLINVLMLGSTALATVLTVSVLFVLLGFLIYKGGASLTWAFFTELPKPVGEAGGGMANAIVGSAKLLVLAAIVGASKPIASAVRYTADLLSGVPSIVVGIFVYTLIVIPMGRFSALAGGVALGVMMIPIMTRSTEEFLQAVPRPLREASLALGAGRVTTIARVIVPAASRGILTAAMLGLARVAGETAPLLFTALGNRFWSSGLDQPTASLPVMIFTYATSPYDDWQAQAWAAGLVLLGVVLLANVGARVLLGRRATA